MTDTAAKQQQSTFGAKSISHDYIGVPVLSEVDFALRSGSVHALVGENGSGKSTLIKILTGAIAPRSGTIYLSSEEVSLHSPGTARALGVGVVHQDYNLFPELTVAQNVYGVNKALPRRRWSRMVDRRRVEASVRELFAELDIRIRPARLVRTLDAAERKFVEIARAMLLSPKFLILDEPTASLAPAGAQTVLGLLSRLRERDVGLMFVSHRLDEVREIADEISVLRDGAIVERVDPSEATPERLAEAITGGVEVVPQRARARAKVDRPSLRVEEAVVSAAAPPIDLELSEGEVFGLTGLLGSGAERLVRMVGGADPLRGKAYLHGTQINLQTPRDALRSGIGFIPEDRKAIGLIGEQSIAVNISLASLESVSRHGVLSHREMSERAVEYCDRLKIRTSSIYLPVSRLSGGNMQKVLLAKWLASGANVLAIEEPTHGIDIGGKAQVHELLREFADSGGTVLLASTDAEEVLELCDRIGLMRHGALSHVMSTGEVTRRFVTEFGAQSPEEVLEQYVDVDYPDADADADGGAAVGEGS